MYNVLVKTHILGTHLNRRIRRPPLIKAIGRVPFKLVSCVGNTDQFDSHTLKGMEAKQYYKHYNNMTNSSLSLLKKCPETVFWVVYIQHGTT